MKLFTKVLKFIFRRLTPSDKRQFKFDLWSIEWEKFFGEIKAIQTFKLLKCNFPEIYVLGLRRYICNETMDTLESARRLYRWRSVVHYIMLFCIYACFACYALKILNFFDIELNFKSTSNYVKFASFKNWFDLEINKTFNEINKSANLEMKFFKKNSEQLNLLIHRRKMFSINIFNWKSCVNY
jgi:hypothetical protein